MRIRTRLVATAAAALTIVASALIGAPGANAGDVDPGTGSLTQNADGTVTLSYTFDGFANGVFICDPGYLASDLSECNHDTYRFRVSNINGTLKASPMTLHAGMPVEDDSGNPGTLPDGNWTLVYASSPVSTAYWVAGLKGALLANVVPQPETIPAWVQAVGRGSQAAACPDGWGTSWQEWAVPITGGWVCSRQVPALG